MAYLIENARADAKSIADYLHDPPDRKRSAFSACARIAMLEVLTELREGQGDFPIVKTTAEQGGDE